MDRVIEDFNKQTEMQNSKFSLLEGLLKDKQETINELQQDMKNQATRHQNEMGRISQNMKDQATRYQNEMGRISRNMQDQATHYREKINELQGKRQEDANDRASLRRDLNEQIRSKNALRDYMKTPWWKKLFTKVPDV